MFGLFEKRPKRPDLWAIREGLFGDVALADWVPTPPPDAEPWTSFEAARGAIAQDDSNGASVALRRALETPGLESRQCLQAWHFLRQLGVQPEPREAKHVHGVVLEVHLEDGLDTLAAYADGGARFINHAGNLVVWEMRAQPVSPFVDDLVRQGQRLADLVGPREGIRRGPPPRGHLRVNVLTPSGSHSQEGPFGALSNDATSGPVIAAGTVLMQALVAQVKSRNA